MILWKSVRKRVRKNGDLPVFRKRKNRVNHSVYAVFEVVEISGCFINEADFISSFGTCKNGSFFNSTPGKQSTGLFSVPAFDPAFHKKKNEDDPKGSSSFLVEISGIEPLTS